MATFTTRLVLRQPDPTDLVSVTSDINASMAAIDAAIGVQLVNNFPSAPFAGAIAARTDQSYRAYFSNGTAPASASWVEVPTSSGTFGGNLNMASTSQLIIGADTNLFRNAANVLRTNDALIVDGATTLTGGVSSGLTLNSGDLKLVGGSIYRNKLSTSAVTVANTTTETTIATLTVPANDAVVGAVYRIIAWGVIGVTGTPIITFRGKVGGAPGQFASIAKTASSGVTGKVFRVEAYVVVLATGVSGSWFGNLYLAETVTTTSVGANTSSDGSVAQTISTTSSQDITITAQWNTASASNTLTRQGVCVERVA